MSNSIIGQTLAHYQIVDSLGAGGMGEVYLAETLRKLRRRGEISSFTYEPETWAYQYEPQNYTVDFKVITRDGRELFLEYKGKMTKETRKKLRAIKRCNPDKTFHIIFERGANKISRGSKTNYLKWAEKEGFSCSNKEVKDEWLCGLEEK